MSHLTTRLWSTGLLPLPTLIIHTPIRGMCLGRLWRGALELRWVPQPGATGVATGAIAIGTVATLISTTITITIRTLTGTTSTAVRVDRVTGNITRLIEETHHMVIEEPRISLVDAARAAQVGRVALAV